MKKSHKTERNRSVSRRNAARRGEDTPHAGTASAPNICVNAECRLRKAGCRGFEGCPGYKGRETN